MARRLAKTFPAIYRTRVLITVFTKFLLGHILCHIYPVHRLAVPECPHNFAVSLQSSCFHFHYFNFRVFSCVSLWTFYILPFSAFTCFSSCQQVVKQYRCCDFTLCLSRRTDFTGGFI
jgi:hypothetical protein